MPSIQKMKIQNGKCQWVSIT